MRNKFAAIAVAAVGIPALIAGGMSFASASPTSPPTNAWGLPVSAASGQAGALPAGAEITTARTITLISRNETATDVDNPPTGFSQGDELTVHSPLFSTAGARVGSLDVHGVFTSVARHAFAIQVVFTASLRGGQIATQGVAGEQATFTGAVAGGTGRYQNARGQVRVQFRRHDVLLTYHLIP